MHISLPRGRRRPCIIDCLCVDRTMFKYVVVLNCMGGCIEEVDRVIDRTIRSPQTPRPLPLGFGPLFSFISRIPLGISFAHYGSVHVCI